VQPIALHNVASLFHKNDPAPSQNRGLTPQAT
jgi:hypothetical protein